MLGRLGCDIFIQVAFFCSVGGKLPFEAIFVSCKDSSRSPTVVILHGGPHSVSVSSYVKSSAFLASLGFNLLIVNYRYGSLNFSTPFIYACQWCQRVIISPGHLKKTEAPRVLERRLYSRFLEKLDLRYVLELLGIQSLCSSWFPPSF